MTDKTPAQRSEDALREAIRSVDVAFQHGRCFEQDGAPQELEPVRFYQAAMDGQRRAISRAVLAARLEQAERMHFQNCGCHSKAIDGDPCYAAYYGKADHHPHPFVDSGCDSERDRLRRELDAMDKA